MVNKKQEEAVVRYNNLNAFEILHDPFARLYVKRPTQFSLIPSHYDALLP